MAEGPTPARRPDHPSHENPETSARSRSSSASAGRTSRPPPGSKPAARRVPLEPPDAPRGRGRCTSMPERDSSNDGRESRTPTELAAAPRPRARTIPPTTPPCCPNPGPPHTPRSARTSAPPSSPDRTPTAHATVPPLPSRSPPLRPTGRPGSRRSPASPPTAAQPSETHTTTNKGQRYACIAHPLPFSASGSRTRYRGRVQITIRSISSTVTLFRRPVVELRRLRRRVRRDLLRVLKRPPGREVCRDPGRPERVAARRGREPCRRGSPFDHRQHQPPIERPARQPAPRRIHALEERHLRLLEPVRLDVGVESRSRPVVGRDVVPLPALLVEPLNQPRLPCPK